MRRAASAVKELVENALDAGATRIEVTLKAGGKTLIAVEDNGKGMDAEDLALAVERHATSKLPSDDLFNVQFLGFRGEALPSIASVAKMKITTRQESAENGWELEIKGGAKGEVRPCSRARGTRIEVRDLFFATPARLKFLKADSAEAGACADIISRIALANPEVAFYLYVDEKKKIALPAANGGLSLTGRLLTNRYCDSVLALLYVGRLAISVCQQPPGQGQAAFGRAERGVCGRAGEFALSGVCAVFGGGADVC